MASARSSAAEVTGSILAVLIKVAFFHKPDQIVEHLNGPSVLAR